ncbi:MAG: S41 family peptidase [Chlamydiota bacterium]
MKSPTLRTLFLIVALLLSASLASSRFAGRAVEAGEKDADIYKSLDILCDVVTIVQRDYIEKLSSEKLMQDALRGILASLDSYSTYTPPPVARETPAVPAKDLGTYGIEVAYKEKLFTVVAPVENGPAWKAGIKGGDLIIKIDEDAVDDRPLVELLQLFRGATARELHLQVVRRGEREFLDFTLKPGKIEGPAARTEMLEDKIALLRISRFDRETPARVAECLAQLKGEGADGVVVDLRDCPAGDIKSAIAIADHFIPAGALVATLAGRTKGANMEFKSSGTPPLAAGPVVALINGGTSGAAEVLAGALQARGRGVLMGQRSFGCAFEEGSFTLKDGSVITMLTAVYQTPDGAEIQDEGLEPDIDVPLPSVVVGEAEEDEEEFAVPVDKGEKGEKGVKGVKGVKGEKGEKGEKGVKGVKQADPMVQRAVDLIKGIRIMKNQERG